MYSWYTVNNRVQLAETNKAHSVEAEMYWIFVMGALSRIWLALGHFTVLFAKSSRNFLYNGYLSSVENIFLSNQFTSF